MRIEDLADLAAGDDRVLAAVADLLVAAFAVHWPDAWPTHADALAEVRASLAPEHLSRVARDDTGTVLGWIGAAPQYDGHVWELHPLAVLPARQGQGIGRALVRDLEQRVRDRGGLTILLGTDDEDGMTSLAGVDLYPNVWQHLATIKNLRRHPYEFYTKLGFAIVGVVPDANGRGKPDILMAKAVR